MAQNTVNFQNVLQVLQKNMYSAVVGYSVGATEESAAIGVNRAKWRDSCTENRC